MAVVKASSRRSRRALKSLSWPNTIPNDRGGQGSRIQKPASHLNSHPKSHRTYPAKSISKSTRKSRPRSSKRAFRSSHGVERPVSRTIARAPAPGKPSEVAPSSRANTTKQTCKKAKDDTDDTFDLAYKRYKNAYERRLLDLRKWVNQKFAERRIDFAVKRELNAYFGKRKFGERPSAKILSKYACQALELSEHDMGTDLAWAKTRTWLFGERWGAVFEKMIREGMGKSDYGVCGPGYVGEDDVESWACRTPYWQGGCEGAGESMEGVEVERSFERGGANNPIDLEESDADALETDEAQGLGILDGMGNVREEEQHEHELEESDFEIDVDV